MNFTHFTGHRRTTESLLDKIRRISATPAQTVENLYALNIFSTVTPIKDNKIALEEAPNSLKMRISSNGKKALSMCIPNIFGGGEFLSIDFNTLSNSRLSLGTSSFLGSKIYKNELSVSRKTSEYNKKPVEVNRVELSSTRKTRAVSLGIESIQALVIPYLKYNFNLLGFGIDVKTGVTRKNGSTPFFKFILSRTLAASLGCFFADSSLSLGRLFGQSNLTEKFFLGSTIRGYRDMSITPVSQNNKVGGNSFLLARSRVGACIKNLELFAFGDVGVTSIKGFAECYDLLRKFGDTSCVGKSVGCGISLRDRKGLSFVYSVPLTSNSEIEKYSFGIDMEF